MESQKASNVDLARKCLGLIALIAMRGALSAGGPSRVVYALQELSQVLYERTGDERTIFPMMPIESIRRLKELHEELDFLNDCSVDSFTTDIRREGLGQPSGSE
jgi:hypothetical protein